MTSEARCECCGTDVYDRWADVPPRPHLAAGARPMTSVCLGVDTGLRRTGIAAIVHGHGICVPNTWLAATEPPRADTVAHRVGRLALLARQVHAVLDLLPSPPVLALVEAPSYGSVDAHFHENAGAWWAVVASLVESGIPVGTCAPATRAKWATGRGDAKKLAVVAAMRDLWPGASCTQGEHRLDECDALTLSTAAAQRLGWPVPVRAWHGASLKVIRWPALPVVTR